MSKKLKLTDREWSTFRIDEILDIEKCKCSKVSSFSKGPTPYMGATNRNNGVLSFVEKKHTMITKGNCLAFICDGEGSIGLSIYKYEDFIGSTTVKVGRSEYLNKYVGMFLTTVADTVRSKYNFGYKRNTEHLSAEILQLPIQTNGTPDWAFMETYMRQVEDELLSEVLPKQEEQLLEHIISLSALEDREWKEFYFSDVFTRIQRGKRLKKDDHIEGTTPYVSSTATNNGIDGFVGNKERVRIFSNCISLANSGSVGSAFFQEFEFVASDHVTSLQKEGIDEYAYLFMLPIISRLSEKYSFNREINDLRISRERLMLPVQTDGTPDWEFMSAFMKKVEQDTLSGALRYFKLKKYKQMLTGGGKMKPFFMEDIIYIANGVRLTKADMVIGNRPFVGASEVCNGITEFVDNTNASIDKEVLGVNYNGSVGFSFYHPYEALFSDDVKRVRWKNENANNKYTLLYLSTAIAQQRSKYAYGYKFNAQRMKRQIIMLPSQADGIPDYAYMEQTMRVMEYDVLKTYLNSINV